MTKKKLRVGVIFGGKSSEREVSLATGRYVLNLVDPEKYEAVPFYMDKKGRVWEVPIKLVLLNATRDIESRLKKDAKQIGFEKLPNLIDVMFIALLGKYGEDGAIQGVLELVGLPYTGSGILASSIGMHKAVHKDLIAAAGYNVARDIRIKRGEKIGKITYPVVVKPVAEGSSVGVSFVRNEKNLERALNEAFKWDDEVLVEEYIRGQEFMCVVLGNDKPVAMQPSEVEFEGDIFSYKSKYMPGQAKYYTPIRASKDKIAEIQKIAVEVYQLIGAKGYGRVDGFLVDDKKIIISEPHTGTIMVPSSYVFQQAALHEAIMKTKAGTKAKTQLSPRKLITTIVDLALDAHSKKKGTL